MNLAKKIFVATALTGVWAMAGLGAVQAEDSTAETPVFQQDEDLLTPHDRVPLTESPKLSRVDVDERNLKPFFFLKPRASPTSYV